MAMSSFDKDMNIIQALNDEPNDKDGLTAGELKAKFDEGGLAVKNYLNNTVRPFVNTTDTNASAHAANTSNPHSVTKSQVGLGNVPNVATNDQTPTYTAASSLSALSSGEKLSVAFGKLKKAVADLISHLANTTVHITASERTSWNSKAAGSHTHAAGDIASGTLAINRGGTGASTAKAAVNNLLGGMTEVDGTVTDVTLFSTTNINGASNDWYKRPATAFWNYIKGKADSVYAAISHSHAAGDITSGTLSVARGGTGKTTAAAAASALIVALGTASGNVTDNTLISTSDATGETNTWYRRPAPKFWNYIKSKADSVYAAIGHNHDGTYYKLTNGVDIPANADLNDETYRTPGNYRCSATANAITIKHLPNYDTTTLLNTDFTAFNMRVGYAASAAYIYQEIMVFWDATVYYRYYTVSNSTWSAWAMVSARVGTLMGTLSTGASDLTDSTLIAASGINGETGTWFKRTATAFWNYIKGKAATELYITAGKKSGTTLGEAATAEGYQTIASRDYSHAEGYSTIANGQSSHAEGYESESNSAYSHAEGYNTVANGQGSHAEGYFSTAQGQASHAEGYFTIANGDNQHTFGKYNVPDTTSVEIVGWGTSSTRKNIRTLDSTGNMTIAGTLTQNSDARLKDVAGEIPDVSGIRAVRFKWNDTNGEHDDKDHIGYLAQDVETAAPYLVGEDSNGYKSLDYIAFLCAKIEGLERRVAELENR